MNELIIQPQLEISPNGQEFQVISQLLRESKSILPEKNDIKNDISPWSAVVLGVKLGQYTGRESNAALYAHINNVSPETGKKLDILDDYQELQTTNDSGKTWIVNKEEIVRVVNENVDFFGLKESTQNYENAREIVLTKLTDSDAVKGAQCYGLLYGYPREDCDKFALVEPIGHHVSGYPDRVGHLQELGFSRLESKFIHQFTYDGPFFLRKKALEMLSKKIPLNELQIKTWLRRTQYRDKYGSTYWVGFERKSPAAISSIRRLNASFKESGIGAVIEEFRNKKS